MADSYLNKSGLAYLWSKIITALNGKQNTLVSGTNIKTVNGSSLLGSGDLVVNSGLSNITDSATGVDVTDDIQAHGDITIADSDFPTSAPSSDYYSLGNGGFEIVDGSDQRVGYLQGTFTATNYRGINLSTVRSVTTWSSATPQDVYNGLSLYVNSSGASSVYVTSPSAWRSALEITPSNIGAASASALDNYVLKAGDIMTGDLTVGKVIATGGLDVRSGSSQSSPPYFLCLNNSFSDGGNVGYVTKANMLAAIGAQAELTAGTNIQINGTTISATDTKYTAATANPLMDGTVAVGTSALYARQDHRHPTDTSRAPMPTNSDHNKAATSVATATDTTLANTGSLGAGTYLISAIASFASNATGRRVLFLTNSTSGSNLNRYTQVCQPAASGAATVLQLFYVAAITSATTFYLRVYQASGSSLNVTSGIQVVKIA